MNLALQYRPAHGRDAFTLIELLLALAIAGVVLAAINAVFFGVLRLRAATTEVTEQALPVDRAIAIIREDLLDVLPPSTNLVGVMCSDTTAPGQTQPVLLELYTSSATVQDDVPYGDIQRIDYSLQQPTDRRAAPGRNIVRGVSRNLLATTPESPQPQVLIGGVDRFWFQYFDGTNWNPTWSATVSNIPAAIKVFITFVAAGKGVRAQPPVQFVVPIIAWQPDSTNLTGL